MGAGKSYAGQRLAQLLGRHFIDLDDLIEAKADASITAIFAEYGEPHFRRLEQAALHSLTDLEPAVIACGGGTPCFFDNQTWMSAAGTVVFLDVAPAVLIKRLSGPSSHRPLVAARNDLEDFIANKLVERRPFYEKADIHLQIDNPEAPVARLIFERLISDNLTQ